MPLNERWDEMTEWDEMERWDNKTLYDILDGYVRVCNGLNDGNLREWNNRGRMPCRRNRNIIIMISLFTFRGIINSVEEANKI